MPAIEIRPGHVVAALNRSTPGPAQVARLERRGDSWVRYVDTSGYVHWVRADTPMVVRDPKEHDAADVRPLCARRRSS